MLVLYCTQWTLWTCRREGETGLLHPYFFIFVCVCLFTAVEHDGQISACSPTKRALHRLGWKSVCILECVCSRPLQRFHRLFLPSIDLAVNSEYWRDKRMRRREKSELLLYDHRAPSLCLLLLPFSIVFRVYFLFDAPDFPNFWYSFELILVLCNSFSRLFHVAFSYVEFFLHLFP